MREGGSCNAIFFSVKILGTEKCMAANNTHPNMNINHLKCFARIHKLVCLLFLNYIES